ncbi:MAG: formimidoylglutamate deiminase [Alphaproteobacteria bacterium]
MLSYYCSSALLPDGWASDVLLSVDAESGLITDVVTGCSEAQKAGAACLEGPVLPGMPNLHSHVFQIGMAGFAERSAPKGSQDDFWQWRDCMYRLAGSMETETLAALAELTFVEMLEGGFTSVAEFHYVHRGPGSEPLERCQALIDTAAGTGIGMTLLPVFYAQSGFGAKPPNEGQQPFVHDLDSYAKLISDLDGRVRLGVAPHSLRAVTPDQLEGLITLAADRPIHIHIAEQTAEVEDCIAHHGARPVQWLLDSAPVGPGWCLIHATHMTEEETRAAAASGAVAGLCPITEANLGDGLFNMQEWLQAGGAFGVGSDSNIELTAPGELRLLDYGQRLTRRRRNLLPPADTASADWLWSSACAGGAQALGQPVGRIAVGHRCDLVTLSSRRGLDLTATSPSDLLSGLIYTGAGAHQVETVITAGQKQVEAGQHRLRQETDFTLRTTEAITKAQKVMQRL